MGYARLELFVSDRMVMAVEIVNQVVDGQEMLLLLCRSVP